MAPRHAFLALAVLLLAGCASAPAPAPPPPEPDWTTDSVPPAWSVSLDYVWPAGKEVQWTWRSGAQPMQFEVVHPTGAGAQRIADVRGNASASGFTVPEDGQYSIYWTNLGNQDAALQHVVPEGYAYERWPPGRSMGCGSRSAAGLEAGCVPGLPPLP